MIKKQYNLRAGYYDEYTGICTCSDTDENLTTNEVVDLLNKQDKAIKELKFSNHSRAKIIIQLTDKINQLEKESEQLKGEVKRLKCINKQLEDRLGRDIALNMDCVEAIEDWENECKRCYGSK